MEYPDPDRLVFLSVLKKSGGFSDPLSIPDFTEWSQPLWADLNGGSPRNPPRNPRFSIWSVISCHPSLVHRIDDFANVNGNAVSVPLGNFRFGRRNDCGKLNTRHSRRKSRPAASPSS